MWACAFHSVSVRTLSVTNKHSQTQSTHRKSHLELAIRDAQNVFPPWNRNLGGAIQVVANVSPLSPVTVPEFFAKANSDQFPSRFLRGERENHSGSVIMRNRELSSWVENILVPRARRFWVGYKLSRVALGTRMGWEWSFQLWPAHALFERGKLFSLNGCVKVVKGGRVTLDIHFSLPLPSPMAFRFDIGSAFARLYTLRWISNVFTCIRT